MINRIIPLINRLIPAGFAFKGLQKLDPRIGRFLGAALAGGYGADQALDYVRSQFEPVGSQQEEQRLSQGMQQGTLRPDEEASYEKIRRSKVVPEALGKLGAGALGLGAGGLAANAGSQDQVLQEQDQPTDGPVNPMELIAKYSPQLIQFIQQHAQSGRRPEEIHALAMMPGTGFENIIPKIERDLNMGFSDLLAQLFGGQGQQQAQPQQQQQPQQQRQQPGQGSQALMQAIQQLRQLRGAK